MGYSILDLIDKFIDIEKKGFEMYNEIEKSSSDSIRIKSISKILAKEEKRHIKFFKDLKNTIEEFDNIDEIDFLTYDKAAFLINKFKNNIAPKNFNDSKEIVNFALEFERENLALLIDVQGRIVKDEDDINTTTYNALSKIIEEERKHVDNLLPFI